MKDKDIKIGEVYIAKVSGVRSRVRVLAERPRFTSRPSRTRYTCENLRTGREVVKTAAALSPAPATGFQLQVEMTGLGIPVKVEERRSDRWSTIIATAPIVALPALEGLRAELVAGGRVQLSATRCGVGREGTPSAGLACLAISVPSGAHPAAGES